MIRPVPLSCWNLPTTALLSSTTLALPLFARQCTDITNLKSVARIDRDGLVLRLTSLQEEVGKLPLANAILPEAEAVETTEVSASVDDWKQNLKTSLKNSDHFVPTASVTAA